MAEPANKPMGTIGMKDVVIAPLTRDTAEGVTYGDITPVAGAIDASVTPQNTEAEVQHADDGEYDAVLPDPEVEFRLKMVDLPLTVQEMILANKLDQNGVLIRNANDKPGYFAVGFKSEKADHTTRCVWLYKVRAAPITENYATKEGETITRQTGEVLCKAIKRTYDGDYQAIADEGLNGFTKEKMETFFSTVYQKVPKTA